MKKQKTIIAIACTIIVAIIIILIINKCMEEKEYWVIGKYPVTVNEKIKKGYKVIGRYKLWNPRPRPITLEDADFINSKLPEWLAERYSEEEIDVLFQQISNQELVNKLQYTFTMLHDGGTTEADFYLLTLEGKEKSVNIYIGKGTDSDAHNLVHPLKQKLIYPFYNEEWHKNIDDITPYKPGDLW